jgi:hypothetical protein
MKVLLSTRYSKIALSIIAVFAWAAVPAVGLFMASASDTALQQQCTDGQLSASLTGTATAGTTPRGTARYRGTGGKKGLQVDVRSVNLPAGTTLTVFVNDTNVGTIALPRNGNGQLKIDTPAATVITDGSTVVVRNDTTDVLSGTFACSSGGGNTNSNGYSNMNTMNMNTNGNTTRNSNTNRGTNRNSNSNTNSNSNMDMNTNSNTNMNTNMNMNSNMNTNTNSNTNSDTLTPPQATPTPRGE